MEYPAKLWHKEEYSVNKLSPITSNGNNGGTTMKVTITSPKGNVSDVAMNPKVYSTGTKGFHGTGKIQDGDKKFQINFQMYEVGSKPAKK